MIKQFKFQREFLIKSCLASITLVFCSVVSVATAKDRLVIDGQSKPIFACELLPFTFQFYQNKTDNNWIGLIEHGNGEQSILTVQHDRVGSGLCKHNQFQFDFLRGSIFIRELGCFGEVDPPENAIGWIEFGEHDHSSPSVFCYRYTKP